MIDENLTKILTEVGVQGIDENTKHEDLPKILKQNKKVLKAHDDLQAAKAEGPDAQEDPEVANTLPKGNSEGDPEVKATTPPAPAEGETKPVAKAKDDSPAEPPVVPAATTTTKPAPSAEPSKPRKFGKAFPDRT